MQHSRSELRYALRRLVENPVFLAVALITLGLAIGSCWGAVESAGAHTVSAEVPEQPAIHTSRPSTPPVAGNERWMTHSRT